MGDGTEFGCAIKWADLTVDDAPAVRDFYEAVLGWKSEPMAMDAGYDDYVMTDPKTGEAVAGVCHKRGGNSELPSQWLIYLDVDDLAESIKQCEAHGGRVVIGPKSSSENTGPWAVIEDPAGAVLALMQPSAEATGS
ncbi:MAG: VOC family protein [Solirubrobacterales bacterium]